jgi:thermostable 8-oxoguanine DNA glycosylase
LLHSRKDYIGAVLDTHLLKFIRAQGYIDAPKSTPPPSKYAKWQKIFLDLCAKLFPDKTIAEVDLEIWKSFKNA